MSSYSLKAKKEIAVVPKDNFCKIAYLSAIIHTAGSLIINSNGKKIIINTENPLIKSSIDAVLENLYGEKAQVIMGKTHMEIIIAGKYLDKLLVDCGIFKFDTDGKVFVQAGIDGKLAVNENCIVSYVKGAFLGCGSVSILEKGYHLEFSISNKTLAADLSHLLAEFNILTKCTERKDKFMVYIKDSQSISDCLALMGAGKAVLDLNTEMVTRQVRRETNRTTNCMVANIDKSVNAYVSQISDIEYIERKIGFEEFDTKLKEMVEVRLANPEANYESLGQMLGISKSGVKHRLNKLNQIANKLREK